MTAAEDARKAFELNSKNYTACWVAGGAWYQLRKYAEALPWCDRAVTLRPNRAEPRYNRAFVHRHLGRKKEALADFEAVRRLDPNYERAEVEEEIRELKKGRTP